MLLNLAEDLKEHAKMKVSPSGKKADAKEDSKKKASPDIDQVKEAADAQAFVKLDKSSSGNIDEDDLEDDSFDADSRQSFLYMELQSTSSFKDIDIDAMLEHTTLEDFMRGLYISKDGRATVGNEDDKSEVKKTGMAGFLSNMAKGQEEQEQVHSLYGGQQSSLTRKDEMRREADEQSDVLRDQAMANLRERRLRLKSSKIFTASATKGMKGFAGGVAQSNIISEEA